MNLLELFKKNKECKHAKVTPDKDICYCPDCGELIENQWYITLPDSKTIWTASDKLIEILSENGII